MCLVSAVRGAVGTPDEGRRAERREEKGEVLPENLCPASSHPIITPCISQDLWLRRCLRRIFERRRNPSRVMVLLYALRAAIFYPYPSCLGHKLCNHSPVCPQQAGPPQQVRSLHALFKKESGLPLRSCSPPSLFLFFLLP